MLIVTCSSLEMEVYHPHMKKSYLNIEAGLNFKINRGMIPISLMMLAAPNAVCPTLH